MVNDRYKTPTHLVPLFTSTVNACHHKHLAICVTFKKHLFVGRNQLIKNSREYLFYLAPLLATNYIPSWQPEWLSTKILGCTINLQEEICPFSQQSNLLHSAVVFGVCNLGKRVVLIKNWGDCLKCPITTCSYIVQAEIIWCMLSRVAMLVQNQQGTKVKM